MLVHRDGARRSRIAGALDAVGFAVLAAGSPIEALELTKGAATSPVLLLTDARLDTGDGSHLAAYLRHRCESVRAIFLGKLAPALAWPIPTYVLDPEVDPVALAGIAVRLS